MSRRLLPVVALALLAGCANDTEDLAESEDAIVQGALANGEHPEVVHLQVYAGTMSWVCTGTLVGRRTVLTARHCFEDGAVDAQGACRGVASVDTAGRGARGAVPHVFERCVLPDLGPEGRANDLALVRLAWTVNGIVPARIAREAPRGSTYTVYGYGDFGATRGAHCAAASDAQKRKVTYRGPLAWHFGRFTCDGDSGGPHFVAGTNVIAGVTSATTAFGIDVNALPYRFAEALEASIAQLEQSEERPR